MAPTDIGSVPDLAGGGAGVPLPGLVFYRWLAREIAATTHEERIVCRRAMKGLCAPLLQLLIESRR